MTEREPSPSSGSGVTLLPWLAGAGAGLGTFGAACIALRWLDSSSTPLWSVAVAVLAVCFTMGVLAVIGENLIEDTVKLVIFGVLAGFAPRHPALDPILVGLVCGGLGGLVVNAVTQHLARRNAASSED